MRCPAGGKSYPVEPLFFRSEAGEGDFSQIRSRRRDLRSVDFIRGGKEKTTL